MSRGLQGGKNAAELSVRPSVASRRNFMQPRVATAKLNKIEKEETQLSSKEYGDIGRAAWPNIPQAWVKINTQVALHPWLL